MTAPAGYGIQKVPLTTDLPVNPENGYGIAKYTAGKFAGMLCKQFGIKFNWLRILSMYGKNDGMYGKNDGENTLISYVIRKLKVGRRPTLTKYEQTWNYLDCDDVVRVFLAVAEHGAYGKNLFLGGL